MTILGFLGALFLLAFFGEVVCAKNAQDPDLERMLSEIERHEQRMENDAVYRQRFRRELAEEEAKKCVIRGYAKRGRV